MKVDWTKVLIHLIETIPAWISSIAALVLAYKAKNERRSGNDPE